MFPQFFPRLGSAGNRMVPQCLQMSEYLLKSLRFAGEGMQQTAAFLNIFLNILFLNICLVSPTMSYDILIKSDVILIKSDVREIMSRETKITLL